MIFNQIDESKKAKAVGDTKAIQAALVAFKKDVGVWPFKDTATTSGVTILTTGDPALIATDIAQITALQYDVTTIQNIKDHLNDATIAVPIYGDKWKGPYLSDVPLDPWGKPYIIPVNLLLPGNPPPYTGPVFIFSAGPGSGGSPVYDTDKAAENLGNDDIGVRIQ
jgi:hypothetical protein